MTTIIITPILLHNKGKVIGKMDEVTQTMGMKVQNWNIPKTYKVKVGLLFDINLQ